MSTTARLGDFQSKIKTAEELRAILGPRPRKKSVVMCHGCFDIVHPGHLRHLMYAKERADILVASLTADTHIHKANLRPYVPEELRAINLAAIQFVDYVIVDKNETPIQNLLTIQPDMFAKGFEYFDGGMHPKTKEELAALESFGGEILFTPGDVIYSSSNLIESCPPRLEIAKLLILMQSEKITFDDLRAAVGKLKDVSVHVVGDTIVDTYTHTRMIGGQTKTPTVSVQYESETSWSGGAAVVSKHMRSTGADVTFTTVLGNDPLKDFVINDLKEAGVKVNAIVDKTRPTTQKQSILCQNYQLLRVGKLDNRTISDKIASEMASHIANTRADVCVFSDFRHGIFNRKTIPALTAKIPNGTLKVADSQVASRWGNILEFHGFDLITPNEREARFALGDQDSVVRPLGTNLYNKAECKYLILTLGDRGIMTFREESAGMKQFFTVDSFAESVVDAVGAGDALLSYASLTLTATKSISMASIIGSFAAAVACGNEGNTPVTPRDILAKIDSVQKACV